jgi:hypothetical protein
MASEHTMWLRSSRISSCSSNLSAAETLIDCSMLLVDEHRRGPNIWFYRTGIGGSDVDKTPAGWRLRTLQSIVSELGDGNVSHHLHFLFTICNVFKQEGSALIFHFLYRGSCMMGWHNDPCSFTSLVVQSYIICIIFNIIGMYLKTVSQNVTFCTFLK